MLWYVLHQSNVASFWWPQINLPSSVKAEPAKQVQQMRQQVLMLSLAHCTDFLHVTIFTRSNDSGCLVSNYKLEPCCIMLRAAVMFQSQ